MFQTDLALPPDRLARLVEERGFESLFLPEHSHVPSEGSSQFPSGPVIPEDLHRLFDPLDALAAAAVVTTRLVLGTSVLVVPDHDPIMLAKRIATVDRLCEGRLVVGVGAGWNRAEMANHGADPDARFAIMRERVEAMVAIWTNDLASYHGTHVRFDPIYQWPKPWQQPHPPIFVGGAGPRVHERVLRYGDGWMASGRHLDGDVLAKRITEFRMRCAERGRDPMPVMLQQGTPTEAALEAYREMGLTRITLRVDPADASTVAQQLDHLAALASPYLTEE